MDNTNVLEDNSDDLLTPKPYECECEYCVDGDCSCCWVRKIIDRLDAYQEAIPNLLRAQEIGKADKEDRLYIAQRKPGSTVYTSLGYANNKVQEFHINAYELCAWLSPTNSDPLSLGCNEDEVEECLFDTYDEAVNALGESEEHATD